MSENKLTNPIVQIVKLNNIEDVGLNNLVLGHVLNYQTMIPKNIHNINDDVDEM